MARAYRDVRLVSIGGGADEIMLGIICKPAGHPAGEKEMSTLPVCQTLLLEPHNGVLYITLNRPESRNAMSLLMARRTARGVVGCARRPCDSGLGDRRCRWTFLCRGDIKDMANARVQGASAFAI